jgi:hypothetical protein
MLLCIVVGVVLIAAQAKGAEKKCPGCSVVLDGSCKNTLPNLTATGRQHIEMHKVSPGKGYDGQWKLDKLRWTVTYSPLPVSLPPIKGEDFISKDGWARCTSGVSGNMIYLECIGAKEPFDVVNNKVGSRAANLWFGTIKGNRMVLQLPPSIAPCYPCPPDTEGVITGGGGPGETISLTVTSPKDGSKHVYNNETPGKLELTLTAKANPAKYNDKIKWTVPKIKGNRTQCTTVPDPPVGPKVKVTYSGLPENNSEFGEKAIVAKLDVSGCEVEDQVAIKVFFPRDATNNPDGKDPNWFYYWKQTKAATLASKARYDGSQCKGGGRSPHTIGYYPDTLPDYYIVCNLAETRGDEMAFDLYVWEFKPGPTAGTIVLKVKDGKPLKLKGIDTFALATLHEAEHYTHLRKWWRDAKGNLITPKRNREMGTDSNGELVDGDGDDIPTTVEDTLRMNGIALFDSTLRRTYPAIQTEKEDNDEETYTQWVSHGKFKPVDEKEDWSYPGKQWKK